MKTIAERIKEGMELRNLKQADIVRLTGITKGALSSYVSGKYEPKPNSITKIANALNVNELWLIGHDVSMIRHDKDFIKDLNEQIIFESYLKILGWTYKYISLTDGLNCGECLTMQSSQIFGDKELPKKDENKYCKHCKLEDKPYVFTNGHVSFSVSSHDFQNLMDNLRVYAINQISELFKKYTDNLFN